MNTCFYDSDGFTGAVGTLEGEVILRVAWLN